MTKPSRLGHITFRLDPDLHQELLNIAETLGTDMSGLLKMMIVEARPAFLERARAQAERYRTASELLDEAVIHPDDPIVRSALQAAGEAEGKDRVSRIAAVAVQNRDRLRGVEPARWVAHVADLSRREELLRQAEKEIQILLVGATRPRQEVYQTRTRRILPKTQSGAEGESGQ